MGIISKGKTTYKINQNMLKQLIAADLGIPVDAIVSISSNTVTKGHQLDTYQEWAGLTAVVDYDTIKQTTGLTYPPGVHTTFDPHAR